MQDEEIDLRPWLRAVVQRWPIILGLACLGFVLLGGLALLRPRVSQADVSILLLPTSNQISLDARFVNRDATLLTNSTFQRQAVIGLATSDELVQRVAADLQLENPTPRELIELRDQVQISPQGDLVTITAQAPSEAEAMALAEAWGRHYVSLVDEIYSRDAVAYSRMTAQLAEAEQRYQNEQQALEALLAERRIYEIEFQQRTLQALVDGSVEAEKNLYTRYLNLTQQLDLILQDALTLRKQVESGVDDAAANTLGLLALQARANGAVSLPIQLSIDSLSSLRAEPTDLAAIDQFIAIVREERDRIADETAVIAERMTNETPGLVTLDAATQTRYQEQLSALRGETEQVRARENQLIQRRDIARSSVELLLRKLEEQRIAELTPQIAVRQLSIQLAVPPSRLVSLVLYGGVGLVLGVLSGIVFAVGSELIKRRRETIQSSPVGNEPPSQGVVKPS